MMMIRRLASKRFAGRCWSRGLRPAMRALSTAQGHRLDWAGAVDSPAHISKDNPVKLYNCVGGKWLSAKQYVDIPDPMNGEPFIHMPNTAADELEPFVNSLSRCPKSGRHNPFKNPERYVKYGEISAKAAAALADPEIADWFARAIQRTCPKSYAQAQGEVTVTRNFLHNFSGDQVRFLARGFSVSGDHLGQESRGYRWPFGPVAIVSPFNFPLEIPVLQLMGALYMGNKPVIKAASTTSFVLEYFVRLLHACGMPMEDVDVIHCGGRVMSSLIEQAPVRLTQFTGGLQVAEQLAKQTGGKVRLEDAGFDWKVLGPDVHSVEHVAWQSDQDAYASTGQKCSAQSIVFMHNNWDQSDYLDQCRALAAGRNLKDLTVGPVLSHTTQEMLDHTQRLASIPGAEVLWGGKELTGHSIPSVYGAIEPTAVRVPLDQLLKPEHYEPCTTEIFGPFQVVTSFDDTEVDKVLEALERMSHHLTAAVVSNDIPFRTRILGSTVNGTTYTGIRARTTGAPQNHWFGPAGDPRGAGIGSPEAIKLVWSSHREIIFDELPQAEDYVKPTTTCWSPDRQVGE